MTYQRMETERGKQQVLALDIYAEGLAFRSVAPGDEEQELLLHNPRTWAGACKSSAWSTLKGAPYKQYLILREALKKIDSAGERPLIVVFGCLSDPFIPFEGKFDAALRIIESLAALRPEKLVIQTRSPLIVLALPVLKSLGTNVSVTIALEQEAGPNEYPGSSPVLERVKAARALKSLGVPVTIQVAPLLRKEKCGSFASLLAGLAGEIIVADPEALGFLAAPKHRGSDKHLLALLQRIAPHKLATNALSFMFETAEAQEASMK